MNRSFCLLSIFISLHAFSQTSEWKTYLKSYKVQALAIESDTIWVGTHNGVVKFNKITGNYTVYDVFNSRLPYSNVRSVLSV